MGHSEGGRNAAIKDASERRISAIDDAIKQLQLERQYYEGILLLVGDSVCARCNGNGKVTYYPAGTGPGQETRTRVPCPECHAVESAAARSKSDKAYKDY